MKRTCWNCIYGKTIIEDNKRIRRCILDQGIWPPELTDKEEIVEFMSNFGQMCDCHNTIEEYKLR